MTHPWRRITWRIYRRGTPYSLASSTARSIYIHEVTKFSTHCAEHVEKVLQIRERVNQFVQHTRESIVQ